MEASYSYGKCFDNLDDEPWLSAIMNGEDDIPDNSKPECSEYQNIKGQNERGNKRFKSRGGNRRAIEDNYHENTCCNIL